MTVMSMRLCLPPPLLLCADDVLEYIGISRVCALLKPWDLGAVPCKCKCVDLGLIWCWLKRRRGGIWRGVLYSVMTFRGALRAVGYDGDLRVLL